MKQKTKLHGDNKDNLKTEAVKKCQREGWHLKVLGARFFGSGYVAVLKRRRR